MESSLGDLGTVSPPQSAGAGLVNAGRAINCWVSGPKTRKVPSVAATRDGCAGVNDFGGGGFNLLHCLAALQTRRSALHWGFACRPFNRRMRA